MKIITLKAARRDGPISNVNRKTKTKSGQGADNAQPHWPFWRAMQFYCRHDQSKSSTSVSSFAVADDSTPTTSSAKKSRIAVDEDEVSQDTLMRRAIKVLDTDGDKWDGIGVYLALLMRELAMKNSKAANKLHMELVKTAMEAIQLEED